MIKPYLALYLIAGGSCGTLMRWCLSHFLPFDPHSFAKFIFLINMLACLLTGFLWKWIPEEAQSTKLFWIVGFGGSFSTFSALGFELFSYLQHNKYELALVYGLSSLILGIIMVWFGQRLLAYC
ncbi:MAG: CrcB family protein [Flavobacteriaceae bacterium]|nr:CrcB family protein [Flavobacteriaceae bacterium]